ncbi:MAG: 50S ribosomal protein L10 [Flavobacteriales bacterium]|jgi:large subunit ribosomal protein L10|tara:strand:+ start:2141 stop:2659 length:519 start_codon:yes stop_codon:yes gene_type:complete
MNKEEKSKQIAYLTEKISNASVFYLADTSELSADDTSKLRRRCFKGDVSLEVVKNTLVKKAMESIEGKDMSPFYELLKGQTSLMISDKGNEPAKIIKEFRKKSDKPVLKGAFVEEAIFIGDDQIDMLVSLKSKEELIGDIITLLQSPAKNVISALNSGGSTIAGLVKTLSER